MIGLSGDDAAAYAREVIESDFDEPGDDDVLRKVHGDLSAKGVDKSEHQVRKQMDDLMGGGPPPDHGRNQRRIETPRVLGNQNDHPMIPC